MTRNTGKAEIVKAAEECIAYQIADIVEVMNREAGVEIQALRVDGGPTGDPFLMQFQSDILNIPVMVSKTEELSGLGAAYLVGIALRVYCRDQIFLKIKRRFTGRTWIKVKKIVISVAGKMLFFVQPRKFQVRRKPLHGMK